VCKKRDELEAGKDNKFLKKFQSEIIDEDAFNEKSRFVKNGLAGKKKGPIAEIWNTVQQIWAYVCDPNVHWSKKALPLAGLVYLVSPVDLIPDVIPVAGLLDDVAVISMIGLLIIRAVRLSTDYAIDDLSAKALRKGREELEKINGQARKRFIISAALDGTMLLCALFAAFLMPEIKNAGIFAASIINYVILIRAFCNIARFFLTVIIPHHSLIGFVFPVFAAAIYEFKSLTVAIKASIVAVTRYYYYDYDRRNKIPNALRIVHEIAADFGLVKSVDEIEDYAADVFYPLVYRFLRAILFNILLFTVCYGVFIFIVKYFMFRQTLGMSLWRLWIYPLTSLQ
jgi:uncharacterized membrane protein YkvA (DUF1232 family)